nr:MAG TPA: hypothetical protein [Caudoviricetes sp.]
MKSILHVWNSRRPSTSPNLTPVLAYGLLCWLIVIYSLLNYHGTPGSVNARARAYNARGRAKHTGRERGARKMLGGL